MKDGMTVDEVRAALADQPGYYLVTHGGMPVTEVRPITTTAGPTVEVG